MNLSVTQNEIAKIVRVDGEKTEDQDLGLPSMWGVQDEESEKEAGKE